MMDGASLVLRVCVRACVFVCIRTCAGDITNQSLFTSAASKRGKIIDAFPSRLSGFHLHSQSYWISFRKGQVRPSKK